MSEIFAKTARLFVPIAIRFQVNTLLDLLAPTLGFEVECIVDLNPAIPKRILAGEKFDLGITNPQYVDDLIRAGKIAEASHSPFGRVPLAVAIKGDGAGLTNTSAESISALFRKARSIAYTGAGTSGKTFLDVCTRMGVLEDIRAKTRPMAAGEPVAAVASGEVELAIAPLSTVIATCGVESVAIFPADLRADIEMSMFLSADMPPNKAAVSLHEALADNSLDDFLCTRGIFRFRFS